MCHGFVGSTSLFSVGGVPGCVCAGVRECRGACVRGCVCAGVRVCRGVCVLGCVCAGVCWVLSGGIWHQEEEEEEE
jgi:hypothetical protein